MDEVEEDEASKSDNKDLRDKEAGLERLLEKLISYSQTASGDMEFGGDIEEKGFN